METVLVRGRTYITVAGILAILKGQGFTVRLDKKDRRWIFRAAKEGQEEFVWDALTDEVIAGIKASKLWKDYPDELIRAKLIRTAFHEMIRQSIIKPNYPLI